MHTSTPSYRYGGVLTLTLCCNRTSTRLQPNTAMQIKRHKRALCNHNTAAQFCGWLACGPALAQLLRGCQKTTAAQPAIQKKPPSKYHLIRRVSAPKNTAGMRAIQSGMHYATTTSAAPKAFLHYHGDWCLRRDHAKVPLMHMRKQTAHFLSCCMRPPGRRYKTNTITITLLHQDHARARHFITRVCACSRALSYTNVHMHTPAYVQFRLP